MRKTSPFATSAVLILSTALLGGPFTDALGKPPKIAKILEFDTMVGLPQALTGTSNPIRGINGGGLPWIVGGASGELKVDGHLEVAVSGLVFAAGPNAGSNTVTSFRAIVSCLGSDGSVVNVTTDPFSATTGPASTGGGTAEIEAHLVLPQPCIAPIIFITSPGGAWFATTGH
jgi:hypothetical protein